MGRVKRRCRRSPTEIRKILSDLQNSGLSRRQFATKRGIPLSTLHAWLRKNGQPPASGGVEVIPVGTFTVEALPIEIELPGGEILRLATGVALEELEGLLRALRQC